MGLTRWEWDEIRLKAWKEKEPHPNSVRTEDDVQQSSSLPRKEMNWSQRTNPWLDRHLLRNNKIGSSCNETRKAIGASWTALV